MTIITPAPPAPDRSDPATFADKADTFVAWMGILAAEINGGALGATFVNGTVGEPSVRGNTDTNTGLNFLGSDVLQLVTNGLERLRIGTAEAQLNLLLTGNAVVSNDTDVTVGRLLKTAPGPAQAFRRGNVIGAVSQSSGTPTGALIERGSNANGTFFRFAGGLQVCFFERTTSGGTATWTYPAAFSGAPTVVATPASGAFQRSATIGGLFSTSVTIYGWTTAGAAWDGQIHLHAIGVWH